MAAAAVAPMMARSMGLVATFSAETTGFTKGVSNAVKSVKKFGADTKVAMQHARESGMKFLKTFGLITAAFLAILGPSEVFRTILGTVFQIYGAIVDQILASLAPAWVPLLEFFAKLATEVLPQVMPWLTEFAEIIGDVIVPILKEFRPEFELLIKAFAVIIGVGILSFLAAFAVGLAVVGTSVRILGAAWGTMLGIFESVKSVWGGAVAFFTGIFTGIVNVFKSIVNAVLTIVERVVNAAVDAINALDVAGIIPDLGHISLPRLEHGGRVLKTGLAVVHEGETYSGTEGGGFGGIVLNFYPGSIQLGAGASRQDARDLVESVQEELRKAYGSTVNTLR